MTREELTKTFMIEIVKKPLDFKGLGRHRRDIAIPNQPNTTITKSK